MDDFIYDGDRRREGLPVVPELIGAAVGGAHGLIASMDVDSWANDPANTAHVPGQAPPLGIKRSRTLWLDLAAVVLGGVGVVADWHEDISETLLLTGTTLGASTLAFKLAQSGKTAPAFAQASLAQPSRAARVAGPSVAAAYMKQESAGIL